MNHTPHIMRLITPQYHPSWRLTLPGSATLSPTGAGSRVLSRFKAGLKASTLLVMTPVFNPAEVSA